VVGIRQARKTFARSGAGTGEKQKLQNKKEVQLLSHKTGLQNGPGGIERKEKEDTWSVQGDEGSCRVNEQKWLA